MIPNDLTIDQLRAAEKAEQESCAQMDAFCREHQLFNVDGTRVKQLCPQFGLVFPRDGESDSGYVAIRSIGCASVKTASKILLHTDRVMHAA